MRKEWMFLRVACLSVIVVGSASAQTTLTIKNSTVTNTSAAVYEVSPAEGQTQLYTLKQDQAVDTKLPADGNTIISLQMEQNGTSVANTPLLIVNVRLANLITGCNAAIPPCLSLTPSVGNLGAKEANLFLAERSATKEYCLSGTISTRNGARYFTLENGLIVRLMGDVSTVEAIAKTCLCGVVGTPPEPLDTIAFEVRSACVDSGRPRMRKE